MPQPGVAEAESLLPPVRPTIASVAARASVSRQTVSNVLNAPDRVRATTRRRVEAAIEAIGYRPNKSAQTLRLRRSNLIAVGLRSVAQNSVLDSFLHALEAGAGRLGYRLLLAGGMTDQEEIENYDELRSDWDITGVVLAGTDLSDRRPPWLLQEGLPFVTFGRNWKSPSEHAWVDVDGASGTREATFHLLERGHRRIAFVGWPDSSGVGEDRRSGWEQAWRAAGAPNGDLLRQTSEGLEEGRRACASVLAAGDPPTAFCCVSDILALGVWTELTARGLEPGRHTAVVGFDDSPPAQAIGMSTVAQPIPDVAHAILDILRDLVVRPSEEPTTPRQVLLAPRLVVRRTS